MGVLKVIHWFTDVSARVQGSNKQTASKSCALSLVRQLFHLGVIEGYTGEKKKKTEDEVCFAQEFQQGHKELIFCL